jgi:putative acetyltransferase
LLPQESVGCFVSDFQGFRDELRALPGKYARTRRGCLLLAVDATSGASVGCAALRDLGGGVGEVKRVFVRPEHRRRGVAAALVRELHARARALEYTILRLDTLRRLPEAIAFYRDRFGYKEIDAYCHNPLEDAVFMECELDD